MSACTCLRTHACVRVRECVDAVVYEFLSVRACAKHTELYILGSALPHWGSPVPYRALAPGRVRTIPRSDLM
eukprot:464853-Pleurochrysis_carterae.AAC.1